MFLVHLFLVLAGPLVGSFIGLLAIRWPEGEPWVARRSVCRSCERQLRWWELLPLLSWLALRGKCRQCGASIPWIHPACEMGGLLVALSAWAFAPEGTILLSCLFGWTLLALAAIDLRSFILPDPLNLLAALLGVAMVWWTRPDAWAEHLIGAAVGYLILFSVEITYRLMRGRDGLGRGDAKLFGVLGLWVGWTRLPDILLIASVSGLLAAILASRVAGDDLKSTTAIAFGPWLALAGWIAWLTGPLLVSGL
ncbi:A24 family peptidase [Henriciella sp.]|uniref:prepilin peptidase n=1 Tax=Henriciella sp. TaxID=1968823 RepID=UPI002604514D|nr:A24 family peptidase [Henriciella sp.]